MRNVYRNISIWHGMRIPFGHALISNLIRNEIAICCFNFFAVRFDGSMTFVIHFFFLHTFKWIACRAKVFLSHYHANMGHFDLLFQRV